MKRLGTFLLIYTLISGTVAMAASPFAVVIGIWNAVEQGRKWQQEQGWGRFYSNRPDPLGAPAPGTPGAHIIVGNVTRENVTFQFDSSCDPHTETLAPGSYVELWCDNGDQAYSLRWNNQNVGVGGKTVIGFEMNYALNLITPRLMPIGELEWRARQITDPMPRTGRTSRGEPVQRPGGGSPLRKPQFGEPVFRQW